MTMNEMEHSVPVIGDVETPGESLVEQPVEEAAAPAAETARPEAQPKVLLQPTAKEDGNSFRNKLIGAACGVALGVLLLTVGFWKTLLLAGLGFLGGYLFGVSDKQQSLKEFINRAFPPKD